MDDAQRLLEAGFTEWEVQRIGEATLPDGKSQPAINLDSPVWQRVMESRREWIDRMISDRGWGAVEIADSIRKYYAVTPKRNPFDFLKAEYKPALKRDFWGAIRARNQRKVKATLKGYF